MSESFWDNLLDSTMAEEAVPPTANRKRKSFRLSVTPPSSATPGTPSFTSSATQHVEPVAKRRFPGPAGLLPPHLEPGKDNSVL